MVLAVHRIVAGTWVHFDQYVALRKSHPFNTRYCGSFVGAWSRYGTTTILLALCPTLFSTCTA